MTDLFGRDIIEPIKGDQMPLFHEPVQIDLPRQERPGSKNAADPRHTLPMFTPPPSLAQPTDKMA